MNLQEVGWGGRDWIDMVGDWVRWRGTYECGNKHRIQFSLFFELLFYECGPRMKTFGPNHQNKAFFQIT